jgi:hypothetical protein
VVGLYTATGAWLPIGEDMSLTTDETGKAETRLPAGSFRVTAATDETAPGSAAVTMNADRQVHLRLSAGGRVTVAVRRDGKPLAGAQVTAFGPDGNEVVRPPDQLTLMGGFPPRRTREDGTLELAHLPPGAVRILVTAPDGRTGDATVTVPDGGEASVGVEIR